MKNLYKYYLEKISIGETMKVSIAYEYRCDSGWGCYHDDEFIIENINKKEIIGRNIKYAHECIKITKKYLDNARFKIEMKTPQ